MRTSGNGRIEGYQSVTDTLSAYGMTMAIEPINRFETYFLNTAADAAKLCDEVGHPNVGVLFDTFHANIEEKSIAAGIRTVGKHLKHVHACENDRGIPGSGHMEWASIFQALRDIHYESWLTIESFRTYSWRFFRRHLHLAGHREDAGVHCFRRHQVSEEERGRIFVITSGNHVRRGLPVQCAN